MPLVCQNICLGKEILPSNFRIVFLPHINTVILLKTYCGAITKPGLPVRSLTVLDASLPTTFKRLLRWLAKSYVIDYCAVFWNSKVLFLSTVYINWSVKGIRTVCNGDSCFWL